MGLLANAGPLWIIPRPNIDAVTRKIMSGMSVGQEGQVSPVRQKDVKIVKNMAKLTRYMAIAARGSVQNSIQPAAMSGCFSRASRIQWHGVRQVWDRMNSTVGWM